MRSSSLLISLLCFVLSASATPVDPVAIAPPQVVSTLPESVAVKDGKDAGSTFGTALWGVPGIGGFQPIWKRRKRAEVQDSTDKSDIQTLRNDHIFLAKRGQFDLPKFDTAIKNGKLVYKWTDGGRTWGNPIARRSSSNDAQERDLVADPIIEESSAEDFRNKAMKIALPVWPAKSDCGNSWHNPCRRRPRTLKGNVLESRSGTPDTMRPRAAEAANLESLPSGTVTRRLVGGSSDKQRAGVAEITKSQVNEHRRSDLGVTESELRVHSSRSELPDLKTALHEAAKGWGLVGHNWGKRGPFKRWSVPGRHTTDEKNPTSRRADFWDEDAEVGVAQPAFAAPIYGRDLATKKTKSGAAQTDFAIPIYGQGGALERRDPRWPLVLGSAKKGDKGQTWGRRDVSLTKDGKDWVLPEDGTEVGPSTIQTARSVQEVKGNQAAPRAPSSALDLDKRAKEFAVPINGWANTRGRRASPRGAHIMSRELDDGPFFPFPGGSAWGERSMSQEADAAISSLLGVRSDPVVEDAHPSQAGEPIHASDRLKGPKWGWPSWAGTKPITSRDSGSAPGIGHKVVEEARERDDDLDISDELASKIKSEVHIAWPVHGVGFAERSEAASKRWAFIGVDGGHRAVPDWDEGKRSLRKREVPQDGQAKIKRWGWGLPWGCGDCHDDAAVISR
ncbi:hypothetical protein CBOM_00612 [Ceraceosorus bombacis]|uniref:Uncharacterized protein n=1 Tax=Ceraceosorus bombacis TaxID=401625 RepID=A0A0P1BAJ3_9BASI|nr:hypothetical protein CBOM_00612 [Ceraceosorus bombacis]